VWLWSKDSSGIDGFLGGNTYVWIAFGLLFALPVRRPAGLLVRSATIGSATIGSASAGSASAEAVPPPPGT
jgi:alpha-1,2-mannosyltransferase